MNRIIRVKSEKGFTMIPNSVFKAELSLRATGLLTYILHLPDDWVLYKTYLYDTLPKDGRDAVKTAWKELEENGFIVAERTASEGRGKLPETNYLVYDNPVKMVGLPSTGSRPSNNRPPKTRLRKTRPLLNTNRLNTNEPITNEPILNTSLVPVGTSDPSPTVNLELEEIKKGPKQTERLPSSEDLAQIRKEHEHYETVMLPEMRTMDEVGAKKKTAEYIREKKPAFYEPYKDLWNMSATANGLAKIDKLSETRMKQFKIRLKDPDFDFIAVLMAIKKNAFLKGDNNRGWRVTWDYIFKNDTNYLKIIEGSF
jgi:hypothetical protein